jgi:hypothetical protein
MRVVKAQNTHGGLRKERDILQFHHHNHFVENEKCIFVCECSKDKLYKRRVTDTNVKY